VSDVNGRRFGYDAFVRLQLLAFTLVLSACTKPAQRVSAAAGRVGEGRFHSDSLGVDKRYRFWLPAGYDAGDERFPVIYYLHGLGGNEDDWLLGGKLDQAADRLELRAIVVMPDGDASFYANSKRPGDYDACLREPLERYFGRREPAEQFCVREPRYEDYLVNDLIKHVDATYRTIADRRARGIAGLSMGGFGALSLAMRHPDVYAAAASHSGVVALFYAGPHPYQPDHVQLLGDVGRWGEKVGPIGDLVRGILGPDPADWRARDPATLAAQLPDGKLALYVDCGTEDDFRLHDSAAYLHDVMRNAKVSHQFALLPGRHRFDFWRARVSNSLAFFAEHLHR
jgi:S-formylglutathione hydrolase FrmB